MSTREQRLRFLVAEVRDELFVQLLVELATEVLVVELVRAVDAEGLQQVHVHAPVEHVGVGHRPVHIEEDGLQL